MIKVQGEDSNQPALPQSDHSLNFSLVEVLGPWLPRVPIKDPDQTGQVHRLIQVFDGRTCQLDTCLNCAWGSKSSVWSAHLHRLLHICTGLCELLLLNNAICAKITCAQRCQNAEKGTHIRGRLLDQAVILFNCIPFQNRIFS